jgi:hypothetical protein
MVFWYIMYIYVVLLLILYWAMVEDTYYSSGHPVIKSCKSEAQICSDTDRLMNIQAQRKSKEDPRSLN